MKPATRLGIGWVALFLGTAYLLTFNTSLAKWYSNIANIAAFSLSIWFIFGNWRGGWRFISSVISSIALMSLVGLLFYLMDYALMKHYNEIGAGGFAIYFTIYYTLPCVVGGSLLRLVKFNHGS